MFNHILVPLDGSPLCECVLSHVVTLAQVLGARVTLLHVLERVHTADQTRSVDPLAWHMRKAEAGAYLGEMAARLQEANLRVEKALLEGQAAERIAQFAKDQRADLIVLSSHGEGGLNKWNISSAVQRTILEASISVMIVRAYQPVPSDLTGLRYERLLVPLDGSQRAECTLPLATTLARIHESQLLLAHVVARPEVPRRAPPTQEDIELANQLTERNRLEATRYLQQLQSRLSLDIETHLLVSDNAAVALHELVVQENVDLVVLSAHGYSGGAKWPYGSMAVSFIAYGTTPLLIVQDLSQDELERMQAEMAVREDQEHRRPSPPPLTDSMQAEMVAREYKGQ
jgi:nucleotide-binding universal stress UspA family protein